MYRCAFVRSSGAGRASPGDEDEEEEDEAHAAPASAASSATSVLRRAAEGVRRVVMGVDARWSFEGRGLPRAARRIPASGGVKLRGERTTRCMMRAIPAAV